MQRVAATGEAAPGGGVFDRFGAEATPIVAPVNARGDVAFFATIARGDSGEGLFRWSRGRVVAVAREGDRVASVGTLSGFGRHPVPALSDDGTVVFAAAIAGGRAVEASSLRATARCARRTRRRTGTGQRRRARRARFAGHQRAR